MFQRGLILVVVLMFLCVPYAPACAVTPVDSGTTTATSTSTSTATNTNTNTIGNITGGAGGAGGNANVNSTINPMFVNTPVTTSSATVQNNPNFTNHNTNRQNQNQNQDQGQTQSNSNHVSNRVSNNNGQTISPSLSVINPQNLLPAPEVSVLIPLQGGKVGDWTATMPMFDNSALVKFNPNKDIVVKILDVYFGNPFSRITYEEVEQYLLNKASAYDGTKDKIRYTVKYQDSVITSGLGGGGAISATGNDGGVGSSGSIVPGISKSTANPIFIITFYEIK